MMAISRDVYQVLEKEAEKREVGVQELFRAVILPEWLKKNSILVVDLATSSTDERKTLEVSDD